VLRKDEDNFAALNEKALLIQEFEGTDLSPRAREVFELSIEKNPRQQRALYWLGYIEFMGGRYQTAEELYTRALSTGIWEKQPSSPQRRKDLLYSRACTRSRLAEEGEKATPGGGRQWELKAIQDLEAASGAPNAPLLENLQKDILPGGDLHSVSVHHAGAIQEVIRRLG